jgi:hypothetical protein
MLRLALLDAPRALHHVMMQGIVRIAGVGFSVGKGE